MRGFLLVLACLAALPAVADEGMWTFDNFPSGAVKQIYGADITPAWLDHVRLSTVRLTNCTASFVSPEGLILTNHHCVESCLAELSTKESSLVQSGFAASDRRAELRCPAQLADVLVGTENVTDAVSAATAGLGDTAANDARKRKLTTLEQSCEQASAKTRAGKLRCQVVTLYQGGQYFLYKYKRYDDVRLVFAPEADISSFGGDPDNFQFPRWSLDFSVLRAYENGKPAATPNHLPINFAGPGVNQLVFVAGPPGLDGAPANAGATGVRSRPAPAHYVDARSGTARTVHSICDDQPCRRTYRAGSPSTACRTESRCVASNWTRSTTPGCWRARPSRRGSCGPMRT